MPWCTTDRYSFMCLMAVSASRARMALTMRLRTATSSGRATRPVRSITTRMMSESESTSIISTSLRVALAISRKNMTPALARCSMSSLLSM